MPKFQSLGRDSVLSNSTTRTVWRDDPEVSIPRSGFCFVERVFRDPLGQILAGFNPSVGILFCRTRLGDSFCPVLKKVSIPRSGFCFVERG